MSAICKKYHKAVVKQLIEDEAKLTAILGRDHAQKLFFILHSWQTFN